jgi:hypothetical protein
MDLLRVVANGRKWNCCPEGDGMWARNVEIKSVKLRTRREGYVGRGSK